jgi:homoserine dehydrogenase
MANVWFDARMTPADVRREAVSDATGGRARMVRRDGRRLKVVASARRTERGGVDAAVELQELAADDPLAILDGQANALELDTWPLGRIVITQRDGGLEKTAYALLSDLLDIAKQRGAERQRPNGARS